MEVALKCPDQFQWEIQALARAPVASGASASGASPVALPIASGAAASTDCGTGLPENQSGPVGGDASGAASSKRAISQPPPCQAIHWPKFKTRKLMGCWANERGVGGTATAYPYASGEFLGEGAFAKVYACMVGGMRVAVKVFPEKRKDNALMEAAIADTLGEHPNVVRLLDVALNTTNLDSLLVYAFGGESLDVVLRAQRPRAPRIETLARQAFRGLGHLHSASVYHSDVKPPNILVDVVADASGVESWSIRVSDLGGVVEVGSGHTCLPDDRTTLWYCSPELLDGQKEALGEQWLRADIWAMALTLAEFAGNTFHCIKVHKKSFER